MKPIRREVAGIEKATRRAPAVERRKGPRNAPHYDVALDAETETNFFTGLDRTMASGGLFIATYDIRRPGTAVTVAVTLPSGKTVRGRAKVAWVRGHDEASIELHPGMGVVFESLDAEADAEIRAFLSRRDSLFWA